METKKIFERRDKINYYLDLAEVVSERATCIRRHYGAVIVKDDEVISTGYVGAPRASQLQRTRLLHPRTPESPPRRTLRTLPKRPRGSQRHHQRAKKRHAGKLPLPCGQRSRHRRIRRKCLLLRHVQAPRHQRRHRTRIRPRQQRQLPRHRSQRLDRKRRVTRRQLRLLTKRDWRANPFLCYPI